MKRSYFPYVVETISTCMCIRFCPISPKLLLQFASNLCHVKSAFLSFLARSVSLKLSEKPRRYCCLKLTIVKWKVVDKSINHFSAFYFAFWSPFALWTFERPFWYFLLACKRLSYVREALGCKNQIGYVQRRSSFLFLSKS